MSLFNPFECFIKQKYTQKHVEKIEIAETLTDGQTIYEEILLKTEPFKTVFGDKCIYENADYEGAGDQCVHWVADCIDNGFAVSLIARMETTTEVNKLKKVPVDKVIIGDYMTNTKTKKTKRVKMSHNMIIIGYCWEDEAESPTYWIVKNSRRGEDEL